MPRRTRHSGVALGFLGKKEVEPSLLEKLLDDLILAEGEATRFLVPVTKDHLSPTLEAVVNYALTREIPLEAVTDRPSATQRQVKAILSQATKVFTVTRVPHKLVDFLGTQPNPKMLLCWDASEDAFNVLELASLQSIEARDLAQGLVPIEWGDPAEAPTETHLGEPMADEVDETVDPDEDEFEPADESDGEETTLEAVDGEEVQPYTAEELADFSTDDLFDLCEQEGIAVDVPEKASDERARKILIDAVLAAQTEPTDEDEGEPSDEDEPVEVDVRAAAEDDPYEEPEGVLVQSLDPELFAKALGEVLAPEFSALTTAINEMRTGVESKLTALANKVAQTTKAIEGIEIKVPAPAAPPVTAAARTFRPVAKPTTKKATAKKTPAAAKAAAKKPTSHPVKKTAKKAPAAKKSAGRGRGRPPLPRDDKDRPVYPKGHNRYEPWMSKWQHLYAD